MITFYCEYEALLIWLHASGRAMTEDQIMDFDDIEDERLGHSIGDEW